MVLHRALVLWSVSNGTHWTQTGDSVPAAGSTDAGDRKREARHAILGTNVLCSVRFGIVLRDCRVGYALPASLGASLMSISIYHGDRNLVITTVLTLLSKLSLP